jgi:uncharacterized protein YjdB
MLIGDQATLTANIQAVGAAPPGGYPVTWLSEFPNVVSVSSSGAVTALAVGSSTIQARAGNGVGYFTITVVPAPVVTGLAITPGTLYLGPGTTGALVPSFTSIGPAPAGGWPVTWTSASPAIATVDAAGVVTGVAPGSTTIKATSGTQTAGATVAVSLPGGGSASTVTAVVVSPQIRTFLLAGRPKLFTYAVQASGPPPQSGWTATWKSSDPSIATVAADGTVNPVAPGIATITATVGGVSGSTLAEVVPLPGVIGVRVDFSQNDMQVGDTLTYTATVDVIGPPPAGGYVITWTSSDPAVASITPNGLLTARAVGSATITATSYGRTATSDLIVVARTTPPPPPPITGITSVALNPAGPIVVATGGRGGFYADVVATTKPPANTLEWPVDWSTNNPAVLSVPAIPAQYMNFTAVTEGIATMTATLGGKSATATVYVATPTGISVSPAALSLAAGQQSALSPTVTSTGPLPPTGYPVGYQVGSPLVASVSPAGVVTALGAGKTRITASAGAAYAFSVVTVTGPGLTLALTGSSSVKGTIKPFDATSYYLDCYIPMTMTATGSGTTMWGNEEWSYDGGPFKTYPPGNTQSLTAGSSMIWRVYPGGAPAPTPAQVKGYTATAKFHYAVNASYSDYQHGVAPDFVITQTYSCQP